MTRGLRRTLLILLPAFVCGIVGTPYISAQTPPTPALRIVVVEGEDAVNVIQQKTAVAPIVEVRDRNDQPVSGAVVRFAIRNGRATFGGARSLAVTTDAAGRAAATGFAPAGSGALQIGATATFQGQTAVITIAQTNVMTAAQAAAVTASAGGTGGSSAGASAGAGAGGGGGLSPTTIAVVGGAVAGGAVAVGKLTGGPSGPKTYSGQFSGTLPMTFASSPPCTRLEQQTGTLTMELTEDGDAVGGTARIAGDIAAITGTSQCTPLAADRFLLDRATVTGTASSVAFSGNASNTTPTGTLNAYTYVFTGSLSGEQVVGTLRVTRTITNPGVAPSGTGSVTYNVTLR